MRILVFVTFMLISGCASSTARSTDGSQGTASWTESDQHVIEEANYIQSDPTECRSGTVLLCSVRGGDADCECVRIDDANARAERVLGISGRPNISRHNRIRRRH
jgi:hypothetical protein